MTSSPSIAIIGAGPSGLLLARLLEINGITDYVVYERDASTAPGPRQQGGTLDLHDGSGLLALQRAGLYEEFSERYARWDATVFSIVKPSGELVVRMGEGNLRPEIDRIHLRQLLLDSIPKEKVHWGHAVSAVDKTGDDGKGNGYTIHFTNGNSATGFRLIVGADGAWSKLRPLFTTAKPQYAGKMYIEGLIHPGNPTYASARSKAGPGMLMGLGESKMLVVQGVADGSYRMYFGLEAAEDFYRSPSFNGGNGCETEDKTQELRQLMLTSDKYFANWAPELKAYLEHSEGSFRAWPLYFLEPETVSWERSKVPGVTLIGDAAHLSTPFVGEGVNCSMHDAVVLAECIVKHCGTDKSLADEKAVAGLENALKAYEEDMFARGQDLIRRSARSGTFLFAEDSHKRFLDFVTRDQDD